MNTNTTQRRYSIRAAAVATTAAVIFGAAACGSETTSDTGKEPAAPAAPAPAIQNAPYTPTSADAAERRGAARDRAAQERAETVTPPGRGYRPIPIP